jgi:hypothetical protein
MPDVELSDRVNSFGAVMTNLSQKFYTGLEHTITHIKEHPVETAAVAVIDLLAAGLFIGRLHYGLNAPPEDHLARFFFSNGFPHFVLGMASVITGLYVASVPKISRFYKAIIGGVTTIALSSPIFIREYIQNAFDSVSDSVESAAGIIVPVVAILGYKYIRNKYSQKNSSKL